jgi:ketosteroid isomerase-like protein
VTIGTVASLVGMLALNFQLRRTAPTGADHPMPETAIAQLPVVTADEDPLVTVPTGAEARALVHEFLVAYEARDAARLAALFAADGFENDNQGTAAIRSDYERTFADLSDVTIDVSHIDSQLNGERLTITGPIVVAYRQRSGESKEVRGTAQWEIARKNGTPRILRLRHDIPPT